MPVGTHVFQESIWSSQRREEFNYSAERVGAPRIFKFLANSRVCRLIVRASEAASVVYA